MSLWSPEWRILADGISITDVTLVGLTITTGRTNIYTQPQAGYCSFSLINLNNSTYTFDVNTGITIEVKDSSGTYIPIFGGRISDISVGVHSSGNTAIVTRLDIIAIGSISRMYRSVWEGSLAQDQDGDQIYSILSDLLVNSWNEVASALQWQNYDPTTNWLNAEDIGLGEIDQPGQYTMEQRNASTVDVYSIVTQIANSALGYIYEDASGNIGYADAAHRTTYLAANGYVELSANHAFGAGIQTRTTNQNIVNRYIINYGNNYNNTEEVTDAESVVEFGPYTYSINSNLHNTADAQAVAQRQIDLRSYPRSFFDSITFPLQNTELDNIDRDALLGIFMGMPIKIVDLPININGGEFTGYVEGWTWRATVNGLSLTITVSPTEFSAVAQKWSEVNASEAWNSILSTLEWQDAIGVIS
jgi:hypothetical protein